LRGGEGNEKKISWDNNSFPFKGPGGEAVPEQKKTGVSSSNQLGKITRGKKLIP